MKQKFLSFSTLSILFFGLLSLAAALLFGTILALNISKSQKVANRGNIGQVVLSTPSIVYASDGQVVTEFFGTERRELISYADLPRITVHATLVREDKDFFDHRGYSISGTLRAAINSLLAKIAGVGRVTGGSTLTQQLSGHLYANRDVDRSIGRKVRELWWAMQIERHLSKQEILETYMNKMPFGHSTYGIQAASRYFFGHGIDQADAAQSVALVVQLSAPSGRFSPLRNPDNLIPRQQDVLARMVERGFISQKASQEQFDSFWQEHDWSRDGASTAFFERLDRAPYFSEHIRTEASNYITGKRNIYTDGYKIFTTVNLDHQQAAEEEVYRGLERATVTLNQYRDRYYAGVQPSIPAIEGLALFFNMPHLRPAEGRGERIFMEYITANMMDTLDITTSMFGMRKANNIAVATYNKEAPRRNSGRVETALITVEQETGYITALIGGSGFTRNNQINRATQSKVMPGSAFKPLYFAEAIASKTLTASTMLDNYPKLWINEDGTYYRPENYNLQYNAQSGTRFRIALAHSLNIPAITVLERIGIDAAIARSARMLGIQDPAEIGRTFPRVWSIGLGIISTSPMQMVRAFASFPNQGQEVIPIAIKRILDRHDRVVVDVEAETRSNQQRSQDKQVLSPQAAFIMTNIMETSVSDGTLYWAHRNNNGSSINQPLAGKTGTTQNWSDAWAIAFTPYYTTAVWYGFDRGGFTLSIRNEASSSAAPVLIRYLSRIHKDLPRREFIRPAGVVEMYITPEGERFTALAGDRGVRAIREFFIEGTGPEASYDDNAELHYSRDTNTQNSIRNVLEGSDDDFNWFGSNQSDPFSLLPPNLDLSLNGGDNDISVQADPNDYDLLI